MGKILITGATGQLGGEVVRQLLTKTPATNIAVLVRDAAKAEAFGKQGIETRIGDYNDYGSLAKAFQNTDKLFFVSGNDIPNRLVQHKNVVKAATAAKVGHIVYTSFQRKNESSDSPIAFVADAHIKTEQWIKASGLTWTILKNALYTDGLPMFIGDKVLETGVIYFPSGEGKTSFTLRKDLAAGSAAVLTSEGHENKSYEFSSDSSLSFGEIAALLSKLTGKKIVHISPSLSEYKETLTKAGVPAPIVGLLAGFGEGIRQGEFDFPDTKLARLIGRETGTVEEFLKSVYTK